MKKLIVTLISCFCTLCIACTSVSPAALIEATEPPNAMPTSKPTPEPKDTPNTTISNESILSAIEQILDDNALFIKCEIDDIKLVASFYAPEGTADALALNYSDVTVQQSWANYVDENRELSKSMADAISRLGGAQVGAISVCNDLDPESIILLCVNGEVLFNIMDELLKQ